MEWRDIKGFEGIYQCNENGEVLNLRTGNLVRAYKGRGHYSVGLCANENNISINTLRDYINGKILQNNKDFYFVKEFDYKRENTYQEELNIAMM